MKIFENARWCGRVESVSRVVGETRGWRVVENMFLVRGWEVMCVQVVQSWNGDALRDWGRRDGTFNMVRKWTMSSTGMCI